MSYVMISILVENFLIRLHPCDLVYGGAPGQYCVQRQRYYCKKPVTNRRIYKKNYIFIAVIKTMSSVPEKYLLQIFEKSAPCLLMKADAPVFTISLVSDAYLRFTGLQRADMIGKSAFTLFPDRPDRPKGAITTLKAILQCIETKKQVLIPAYAYHIAHPVTKRMEEFWWSSTFDPIIGDDGEVAYVLGTAADLTEQVKAGAALRAAKKRS